MKILDESEGNLWRLISEQTDLCAHKKRDQGDILYEEKVFFFVTFYTKNYLQQL